MERISIFNYEAFYLDFLEGNLSKEDTVLLLAFLEKNPSLELMDGDLPTLETDHASLSILEKENLKKVDEEGIITLNNAEHFLIAQQEGVLSEQKSAELTAFVNGKPALERERSYIQSAVLIADPSIVYQDKGALKQKRAIIFWPYIATAAAACLLFVVWTNLNGTKEVQQFAGNEINKKQEVKETSFEQDQDQMDFVAEQVSPSDETSNHVVYHTPVIHSSPTHSVVDYENQNPPKQERVERLNRRMLKTGVASIDEMEIESIVSAKSYANSENAVDDPLWGFGNADNPIEPITARIKKRLNTEVDFRSVKPTREKSGGFFLKIGKFELARKKH